MGVFGVCADPENFRVRFLKGAVLIAKLANLFSSTRGVVFWVKEDHHVFLSKVVGQAHLRAVVSF
jgi:hypothetical protein